MALYLLSALVLYSADHGWIAFASLLTGGIFIVAGTKIAIEDKAVSNWSVGLYIIGALISMSIAVSTSISANEHTRAKEEQAKIEAEKQKREAEAEAALTPAQRKQREFESKRVVMGYLLSHGIKNSAFDPDALKIKEPVYYSNGVCVSANGKNRFGAYVGWKEYCYLVDKKGKWVLHE